MPNKRWYMHLQRTLCDPWIHWDMKTLLVETETLLVTPSSISHVMVQLCSIKSRPKTSFSNWVTISKNTDLSFNCASDEGVLEVVDKVVIVWSILGLYIVKLIKYWMWCRALQVPTPASVSNSQRQESVFILRYSKIKPTISNIYLTPPSVLPFKTTRVLISCLSPLKSSNFSAAKRSPFATILRRPFFLGAPMKPISS